MQQYIDSGFFEYMIDLVYPEIIYYIFDEKNYSRVWNIEKNSLELKTRREKHDNKLERIKTTSWDFSRL